MRSEADRRSHDSPHRSGARGCSSNHGGTGLGPRDVTPEATKVVADREVPGFGELMRLKAAKPLGSPRSHEAAQWLVEPR